MNAEMANTGMAAEMAATDMGALRASEGKNERAARGWPRRLGRAALAFARVWIGALLCRGMIGSIAVIGWTSRMAQRTALKQWWRMSGLAEHGTSFAEYAALSDDTRLHAKWPAWFAHAGANEQWKAARGARAKLRALPRIALGSLALNFKLGAQMLLTTWTATAIPCLLWVYSWTFGWNNSFNKGYEQYWIGPTTGLLGVALFILVMFYLPLAQARQAAAGDWRAFYDFRLIRKLARAQWVGCLFLAGLYAAVSAPVMFMRAFPVGFTAIWPELIGGTEAELLDVAKTFYFWACVVGFAAFALVRMAGARLYGYALANAVRNGTIQPAALAESERRALGRLGMLESQPKAARRGIAGTAIRTGARVTRWAGAVALFVVWFAFVAQIFVSEFVNYHPFWGYANQPLVQMPVFQHIPKIESE